MSTTPPDDYGTEPNRSSSPEASDPWESDDAQQAPATPATPAERFKDAAKTRQEEGEDEPEEDLWAGRYSSRAMIGKWVLAAFVTVALLVGVVLLPLESKGWLWVTWLVVCAALWGFFAMQLAYRKLTFKYRLTTQRFIHESGLLKRITDRIEVIDIDDVQVEQGVVERMIRVGTIVVTSSDRTHPKLSLAGIEDVKNVADTIDDARRKERRRRGLHIESI